MSVQERIKTILLLEKIKSQQKFCEEIGLSDASTIDGVRVYGNIEGGIGNVTEKIIKIIQ